MSAFRGRSGHVYAGDEELDDEDRPWTAERAHFHYQIGLCGFCGHQGHPRAQCPNKPT